MRRSLQQQLSRALGAAIVLAGVVAGAVSFASAFEQAQELQDDALRQIAALVTAQVIEPKSVIPDVLTGTEADWDSRITIASLADGARPAWLAADLAPGFHTLPGGEEPMRVYVASSGGKRVAIAQPTDLRNDSAVNSALATLVPLLVLLPVLVWLAIWIVRRELSPVRRLATALDEQPPDATKPLPAHEVPAEIGSFVESINRLLRRVNELIGSQRRFIADAAHELRSPLAALYVQAGNLDQSESAQDRHARVAAIKSGIERQRHLTEQLLDLARLQIGATEIAHIDASRIARDLIAEYIPLAERRGIDVGMEETVGLYLRASALAIRLILKNALDNALRYTPSGGQVTVRLASEGESGVIEVIDTGPGIPESERSRVFAPFYRIPGAAGEGSGLGLAIADDAAVRSGGAISVEQRTDRPGTVFRYSQRSSHA